jgi:hypothetical protein
MNLQDIIDCHKGIIDCDFKTIYKKYQQLSNDEACELFDAIILLDDQDLIESIALRISTLTEYKFTDSQYFKLIDKEIFYQGVIYRHASNLITDKLISLFDSIRPNLLLLSLSWIGNEKVIHFLEQADFNKPKWTKDLFILPTKYTEEANWIISNHKPQKLYYEEAYQVVKNDNLQESKEFKSFLKQNEKCKCCNTPLTTIFKIPSELFKIDKINRKFIEIVTCLNCIGYTNIFIKTNSEGKAEWHNSTVIHGKKDLYISENQVPQNFFKISNEHWKPIYSANQFLNIPLSNIGGMPTWVNDSFFPQCPECESKMKFIAQFTGMDFFEYINGNYIDYFGEGTYYFFICEDCLITSSSYDQT